MYMGSVNPIRDAWFGGSIIPGAPGPTGLHVNTSNIVGPVSALVIVGPGLAAPLDVTFECASEDPANLCTPLASSWAPISNSGFCGQSVAPLTIRIDPTEEPYLTDGQALCRDLFECPCMFIRAVLSAAAPVVVLIGGKARVQEQI